jgi:hypothetical protein
MSVFWRNILPSSSGLKMEAVCSSETLVSTYKPIRRFNPYDQQRHIHRLENLKSHIAMQTVLIYPILKRILQKKIKHVHTVTIRAE